MNSNIRGFIVTTRFKPEKTVEFMSETVARYPELKVYRNHEPVPDRIYETEPGPLL